MVQNIGSRDVEDWTYDLKAAGKSPGTVVSHTATAKSLVAACDGDLTRSAVQSWLRSLSEVKSPATVRQRLTVAKIFCKWLHAEGLTEENPSTGYGARHRQRQSSSR